MSVYENCKIYGPYRQKYGRKHVVIIFPDKTRKTVSYPRYLTEIRLGRYLTDDETVDHKDRNFNNNDPSNIRIVDRPTHGRDDAKKLKTQVFVCPTCGNENEFSGNRLSIIIQNRRKGKAGPFCNRSCAGKYGKKIQMGEIEKLEAIEIIPEYHIDKNV